MSFGDHLEELRKRVIYGLLGLLLTTVVCFNFGGYIIKLLTRPYVVAMNDLGLRAHLVQLNPPEAFIEYFKLSLHFGVLLAAPWMLYQLWLFVSAGLYPSERRIVRLFAPASIILFLAGASFMITVALRGLLAFLINVSSWFPMPSIDVSEKLVPSTQAATQGGADARQETAASQVPVLRGNPQAPEDGQCWVNAETRTWNVFFDGKRYSAPLDPLDEDQFVQPLFNVAQYLGFVVNLALAFGFGFQIPIVVVFLIAMRIATAAHLSRARKYVILGVVILAAILTPTPDVGTMMLLAVPMIVLFEGGLLIGRAVERRQEP